jgi:hypothetical protein
MDSIQILIAVIGVLSLPLGYLAWKSHKNGVSMAEELKLLRPALLDHAEALARHAVSLETHAEAVKQTAQPNVPGVVLDPQPNVVVIRHEFPPPVAPAGFVLSEGVAPGAAVKSDPVSIFLGPDTGTPAKPSLRDENVEGQMISQYIADHHPELGPKFTRVNKAYCQSLTLTPEEACKLVQNDADLDGRNKELADAQRIRDEQANVAGADFKGFVDVARLSLDDGFYLSAMAGRYAALTGQGSIWTAMLYGSATACNAFINLINSTNAGRLGTFDVDSYQGQMKALVEAKIGGNT